MKLAVRNLLAVATLLVCFRCHAQPATNITMKTISYRGGIVTFRIPADWKEEYEKDGGATFYLDDPDSGTLRLSVLTFELPSEKLPKNGYEVLLRSTKAGDAPAIELANGNGMRRRERQAEEEGEKLVLYSWGIANVVPPKHYRTAVFTWTILVSQSKLPRFKEEIERIESELKNITFSPVSGVAESEPAKQD